MLKFPEVNEPKAARPPRMSLKEYAEFCEFCLKNNPLITPENCMGRGAGIHRPFSMKRYLDQ
jgi:hypothetical protein